MLILNVPKQFQPNYKSNYPEYSNGLNMEEVFYKFFLKPHSLSCLLIGTLPESRMT